MLQLYGTSNLLSQFFSRTSSKLGWQDLTFWKQYERAVRQEEDQHYVLANDPAFEDYLRKVYASDSPTLSPTGFYYHKAGAFLKQQDQAYPVVRKAYHAFEHAVGTVTSNVLLSAGQVGDLIYDYTIGPELKEQLYQQSAKWQGAVGKVLHEYIFDPISERYSALTEEQQWAVSFTGAALNVGGAAKVTKDFVLYGAEQVTSKGVVYRSPDEFLASMEGITFHSSKNVKLYERYHLTDSFEFAEEYNHWLRTTPRSDIQCHHVVSDKHSKILKHDLFKADLLNVDILNDPRNIMPLPRHDGSHPTMNTHSGRHLDTHTDKMMNDLGKIYKDLKSQRITKDQVEGRYWQLVDG